MGLGQSKEAEKKSPTKAAESPKKRSSSKGDSEPEKVKADISKSSPVKSSPTKGAETSKETPEKQEEVTTTVTPPIPDEIIPVSSEDLATIEAATKDKREKDGGLKYDVVLSPAVKKAPKLTDASPAPTEEEINRKLKDAEERRISLDNLRMKNLTAQLARIEIAQQKKEDIVQEKSTKAAEILTTKLTTAEEKREKQLQEVKDKVGEHMGKIEKAQKELELSLEAAKVAAEAQLSEKMDQHQKKRDEEMEEMLKKIKDHQEKVSNVRSNQEERLKPYVAELETSINQKFDRARAAKERQDEIAREKLAEQNRRAELVRQNKERIQAEGGANQTTESA